MLNHRISQKLLFLVAVISLLPSMQADGETDKQNTTQVSQNQETQDDFFNDKNAKDLDLVKTEFEIIEKPENIDNLSKVEDNIKLYLSTISKYDANGSERHIEEAINKIKNALFALGYYQNEVILRKNNEKILDFAIKLGNPVILKGINIEIDDFDKNDKISLLNQYLANIDKPISHASYDSYKSELQTFATAYGYFDAKFQQNQFLISPSINQAFWQIKLKLGDHYRYGKINVINSQIKDEYIKNSLKSADINEGDYYSVASLSNLTNKFSGTNWFSSILVNPVINNNKKLVDLDVLVTPNKKNRMEVGVGYSSDEGARVRWSWIKPWLNKRGHSVEFNTKISKIKQNGEIIYKIPLQKDPLNYYYEFSTGLEHENKNDTKTTAATFAALRYWNRKSGWQISTGLRVRLDKFTQAEISRTKFLVYPTLALTRTRLRGGLFPTWGDTQKVTLNYSNKIWGSSVNFYSILGSSTWIRTFYLNHRFVAQARLGYIKVNDITQLPSSLRFFAGGDRNIRGYRYKTIAPRDKDGLLVGGSHLATGSFEYQYQFIDNWWSAWFYDAGYATNNFNNKNIRHGVGSGVRWKSPVGMIKFDIATPVGAKKDSKRDVQFYFGIGSEL